jgi:multidrug efflux pump subunit AcrA (membrane-fusion protein)
MLFALAGCDRDHDHADKDGHDHPATAPHAPVVSNRIDVPERVRANLGITFAKVERRRVAATLRVPGRFELVPSARREYRAPVAGRVELLVKQYEAVEAGQVVARLDSPEWRRVQHEVVEAEGEIKSAEAGVDVADATAAENDKGVELLRRRVAALAEANARRAELETELALAEAKSTRLAAELRAAKVKLSEAREHYASRLNTVSSLVGLPVWKLTEPVKADTAKAWVEAHGHPHAGGIPMWRTIRAIELRAAEAGVVEATAVTNGGWVEAAGLVLSSVDPRRVRFRGTALQADLGQINDGAAASVVAPKGAGGDAAVAGKVAVGLEANPQARTVEVIVTPANEPPAWARPGVSGFAEVVTDDSEDAETAIPVAAVVQDELARVYFRRDPKDANKVIRVEGDFGVSDGKWIVLNSGVKVGDEVVLDGVYELKLTGSGKTSGGGHFHADGTWHADGTPEPGSKK